MYRASKGDIRSFPLSKEIKTIKVVKGLGRPELGNLYMSTIKKAFWNPWSDYLEGFVGKRNFFKTVRAQAFERVSPSRTLILEKSGKPVAILALSKTDYLFFNGTVDWVLWAWIDASIKGVEREFVRHKLGNWVKSKTSKLLVAATEPFNKGPQLFWQRLGLKLECVSIRKPAN